MLFEPQSGDRVVVVVGELRGQRGTVREVMTSCVGVELDNERGMRFFYTYEVAKPIERQTAAS